MSSPVRAPGPRPRPQPVDDAALAEIREQLYGHVIDCIDFPRLYGFEQMLWGLLDRRGIEDLEGELAKQLLVGAVTRAASDPACYFPVSPPHGITKEEARAVEFDEACPFCKMEAEQAVYAASPEGIADEAAWQAKLADMARAFADTARAWRAQHAEALKRRGIAPPATAEPAREPANRRAS